MFLKLTIPPQVAKNLTTFDKIEAIFEVIGYYNYGTSYRKWILSNNTLFIQTDRPFLQVILIKNLEEKDSNFVLEIFWEKLEICLKGGDEVREKRTELIVSDVEIINDYPLP